MTHVIIHLHFESPPTLLPMRKVSTTTYSSYVRFRSITAVIIADTAIHILLYSHIKDMAETGKRWIASAMYVCLYLLCPSVGQTPDMNEGESTP